LFNIAVFYEDYDSVDLEMAILLLRPRYKSLIDIDIDTPGTINLVK